MKAFSLFFFLLLSATAFFSCSKEDEGTPTDTIEGKWVGTYGFGSENPGIFFSFNIKPGGVIQELGKSGSVKGEGTWELNGDTFTATWDWGAPYFTVYSANATFDKAHGKLEGFWGYDDSEVDGGKWEMEKTN